MIWIILALTTLHSISASAIAGSYAQVTDAARQAAIRAGMSATASGVGCSMALLVWAIAACWCVYAYLVGDWRFAAIALIPKAMGIIVHLARPSSAWRSPADGQG